MDRVLRNTFKEISLKGRLAVVKEKVAVKGTV